MFCIYTMKSKLSIKVIPCLSLIDNLITISRVWILLTESLRCISIYVVVSLIRRNCIVFSLY